MLRGILRAGSSSGSISPKAHAVTAGRSVEEHAIIDELAGRGEDLERRKNVDVALLVESEVLA